MAFDIVGPFKCTKRGCSHILTAVCMGTCYPYVCAFKEDRCLSVTDELMEILSHTGIPVELLTDQGAVFVGKVGSEICTLLNIKHITTTAYHPQSNGALERWHGCLKGMFQKLEYRLKQWELLLKYCLLAYRATPHAASGLSPFELVHSTPLWGPLEAVKDKWVSEEMGFASAIEWVNNLVKH